MQADLDNDRYGGALPFARLPEMAATVFEVPAVQNDFPVPTPRRRGFRRLLPL